jgi:hypothetical protein
LTASEIEKRFVDAAMDIKEALDGIGVLPDGFHTRSNNCHGQLPEIRIRNKGNTFQDKDGLATRFAGSRPITRFRSAK